MRAERQPTGRAARAVGFLALGALVLGANAGAQTIPAHPSDLTYELLDFTPPTAVEHRRELSNGIVVFVVEDHELPLVSVGVTVRTGAWLDPPDKIGLAGLTGSQMRAGGTTTMSAADFDEEAAFLAAQIGSNIGATSGGASMNCLTRDLDACLDLFFDMLRHPGFDEERLALAKRQAVQQMERRNDATGSIERREWQRLMRGDAHFLHSAADPDLGRGDRARRSGGVPPRVLSPGQLHLRGVRGRGHGRHPRRARTAARRMGGR